MGKSIEDPAGIETDVFYEVWSQQPRGNWKNGGKVFRSKRAARDHLREERYASDYTKGLKWRVYRVRRALNRERM